MVFCMRRLERFIRFAESIKGKKSANESEGKVCVNFPEAKKKADIEIDEIYKRIM
jgi:hypothetical protein